MIKRWHTVVGQKKLHRAPLLFLFSASDIRETWQLAEETVLVHVITILRPLLFIPDYSQVHPCMINCPKTLWISKKTPQQS